MGAALGPFARASVLPALDGHNVYAPHKKSMYFAALHHFLSTAVRPGDFSSAGLGDLAAFRLVLLTAG
jgi:hypothetical protein